MLISIKVLSEFRVQKSSVWNFHEESKSSRTYYRRTSATRHNSVYEREHFVMVDTIVIIAVVVRRRCGPRQHLILRRNLYRPDESCLRFASFSLLDSLPKLARRRVARNTRQTLNFYTRKNIYSKF